MNYHQKISIAAVVLATGLPAFVWAQAAASTGSSTQQVNAQSVDAAKDRKSDKKTERRDERAEKRVLTERQHAHRRHHPKTITP